MQEFQRITEFANSVIGLAISCNLATRKNNVSWGREEQGTFPFVFFFKKRRMSVFHGGNGALDVLHMAASPEEPNPYRIME